MSKILYELDTFLINHKEVKEYAIALKKAHKLELELKEQKLAILEKALELAVSQLDDAKEMLRECGKRDWAGMLDTSVDYFKARAKEMKSE